MLASIFIAPYLIPPLDFIPRIKTPLFGPSYLEPSGRYYKGGPTGGGSSSKGGPSSDFKCTVIPPSISINSISSDVDYAPEEVAAETEAAKDRFSDL